MKYRLDDKLLRKRMIDANIKSINDLAVVSGVSRPAIYELINGKSPFSIPFTKLCGALHVEPMELLTGEPDHDAGN